MSKDKRAKRNKKPGKLKDLPAKEERAAAVKGGVQLSGSNENPTESVSFRR